MILSEHFERSGNWLFKWRSYLPLIVIGIVIIAMCRFHYLGNSKILDAYWEVFCFIVSFTGLAIRIYTIGHVPKGTSGRNTHKQVADSLNTTGIYSIVRNPLYLGNFFMGLGVVLFAHLWWLTLIYILIFWLYYERIIWAEESFLRRKFGDEYLRWTDRTPAFIPSLKHYRKSNLTFSLRNVLKREYHGYFALILVMFFLEVTGDYVIDGKLEFDPGWLILVGISFIIWFSLRMIKKKTKILNVPGR